MYLKTCALTATALLLSIPAATQTPAPAPKPKSTTSAAAKPAAAPTYDHALLKPALLKEKSPDTYQVKFDTTRGEFTITVSRAWAPLAADRFYNLVKHHFFDNSRFFRVSPGFVVQFGLSGIPAVNAAWDKATIMDEPVAQKNVRGSITFAKTGAPNSRGTQLFINLKDNTFLDSQGFAPFGVVDGKGINVVEMMYDQYGDAAGVNDQENITKGGEKYIAAHYPKLDTIKSATLIGTAATTPAKPATTAKPAAKPAAKQAPTPAKPQQ
ncbi:MAG TPA: peptidylprolyl isomerase [Candidatus Limnocylindrales bacterium]|nr:peptidylprolyl isomerase [Candidatus Limnocylindrales bacterium]